MSPILEWQALTVAGAPDQGKRPSHSRRKHLRLGRRNGESADAGRPGAHHDGEIDAEEEAETTCPGEPRLGRGPTQV
jgi:hypothetical protein